MESGTVAEVMSETVIVTSPSTTLKALDQLLMRHQISGVPVVDDGALVGVVSQHDIVRTLLDEQVATQRLSDFHLSPYPIPLPALESIARGKARLADRMVNLTVDDIMSREAVTIAPAATVAEAARTMIDEGVHRLVVVERGRLVGLLSAIDLLSVIAAAEHDDATA